VRAGEDRSTDLSLQPFPYLSIYLSACLRACVRACLLFRQLESP